MTKQKMARRHNREGGNHLDQKSNRQKTMEDTDGGLHPAVDGQSLGERQKITRNLTSSLQAGDKCQSMTCKKCGLLVGFAMTPNHFGQQFVVSDSCAACDVQFYRHGRADV